MPRSQLAINCPAPLLERLRAEAQRQGLTTTALVLAWLEAGLDGRLEATGAVSRSDLEDRLGVMEQRLVALERAKQDKGSNTTFKNRSEKLAYDGKVGPELSTSGIENQADNISLKVITTTELADRLGLKRNALNERLRRAGGAAIGLELEGWRIVGKTKSAQGGPQQWQWQHV